MAKYKLEYIWLDGYEPVPNLRGKTKIEEFDELPDARGAARCGASTAARRGRPTGSNSDCMLKPVAVFPDPARTNGALVMCEVMLARRNTASDQQPRDDPGRSGTRGSDSSRSTSSTATGCRSASRREGFPAPQGEYYTGVGYKNVGEIAREIVDTHLDLCLEAGINHEGINAEVAKGQWEFQIFGKGSKQAADEVWIARYLMLRLCEQLRRRRELPLQAARRRVRLERLRHARELLDEVHARGRRRRRTSRR